MSSSNNKQEKINKNVGNKSDGASNKIIAENVDQNRADKKRKSFYSKDNEQKNPVKSILLFSMLELLAQIKIYSLSLNLFLFFSYYYFFIIR